MTDNPLQNDTNVSDQTAGEGGAITFDTSNDSAQSGVASVSQKTVTASPGSAQATSDVVVPAQAKTSAPAETVTTPVADNPTITQGRKIMVVEDDMFISDIYDVKLSSVGYDVILANNGRDAIEKLTQGAKPHLMLLDIVMPYMDGFDVLDAIAKNPQWQKIPVVLLTNLSQKEDIDRAMDHGAKDYLIKSHFTPSEVLSKVEKYIIKD